MNSPCSFSFQSVSFLSPSLFTSHLIIFQLSPVFSSHKVSQYSSWLPHAESEGRLMVRHSRLSSFISFRRQVLPDYEKIAAFPAWKHHDLSPSPSLSHYLCFYRPQTNNYCQDQNNGIKQNTNLREVMEKDMHPAMVIIGMLNGMIGGVILVLPLLVLQSGSIGSALIITLTGIFSYYSCMLCVKHLGTYPDLDQSILHHFHNSITIKIFYNLIVFLNLSLLLILYFELIVQQWQGMSNSSIINPIVNFFVLLALVAVMKYYQFGVSLLAYGIVSCVGYCVFLVWMLVSAPVGGNSMVAFGGGVVTLAASMGQAFSIQTIFIPILRKSKNIHSYQSYTLATFIAGFSIYMYIGYMGAFGILNREPATPSPQTIQQYFHKGYWQLYCLQIIYLVHLYSVFPEFLLISSKRFFAVFGWSVSERGQISVYEGVYAVALMGGCVAVSLSKVEIGDIIELNGAVVGFFFIYFLPLIMHVKCLYFPASQGIQKNNQYQQIEITQIVLPLIQQARSSQEESPQVSQKSTPSQPSQTPISQSQEIPQPQPKCFASKPTLPYIILDAIMLTGMMATGAFIMYEGLANVFG